MCIRDRDGSIGKISENRFARADLEHTLLCVDDDMRMEALRQTNYVKMCIRDRNYLYLYRQFVEPDFGKSKVSALKKSDVKQFYNTLADEDVYKRQV